MAIFAQTGIITTVAGNGINGNSGDGGPAVAASLLPNDVALDAAGNLYVACHRSIRRVDTRGTITTIAGGGSSLKDGVPATWAVIGLPDGLTIDLQGNLYIADHGRYQVLRVDRNSGIMSVVAGNGTRGFRGDGGPANAASLDVVLDVALDACGNVFIVDQDAQRIRRVDASTGIITTAAGNGNAGFSGDGGLAVDASLRSPTAIACDSTGNLFIADHFNSRIRRVDAIKRTITTVAGGGHAYPGDGGQAIDASLGGFFGLAVDQEGGLIISESSHHCIRRVDALTGIITTIAGNREDGFSGDGGPATDASLLQPAGVATDANGNLFIADMFNFRVRRVQLADARKRLWQFWKWA